MSEDTKKLLDTFVEIDLIKPENFLIVKETLERIGVVSNKTKTIYPSCGILHKQGKFYIVHFLEMFRLDNKHSNFSEEDKARRNTIAYLLEEWGLIKVKQPKKIEDRIPINQLKIVSHKEKKNYRIEHKYEIGA